MRRGGAGMSQGIATFSTMNIDAQDARDKQDESLLHEQPVPAVIESGITDALDCRPAIS